MNAQADTLESAPATPALGEGADLLGGKTGQNLDMVLDIPINLSLELGHTRMSIRELLRLTQGSVVKLDRPGGDPLDILVNGCLVARGEVVVVNDRFGVRITDIVSQEERVRRLR
ncbi:MAG: flagellar motor switch protein FliN [Candidatus Competibacter denitrificans]|jgi:flagellar motor switch protein FliN/FliY|uniref:Flagellar motor switch protein FliN n=1 Tax=Candidatus Competibacter denitrificans Run_A_D11 TaxID=1400863 RepID=W6M4D2_9GAMM|nr:flagellar motor switch protein FliN [Candidatus Competibacter denitrificans]CDI02547.1 flagellar biosynthesis; component of motor switch and energizing [Candidatus Competibacter denitrificans Run_A_D11]